MNLQALSVLTGMFNFLRISMYLIADRTLEQLFFCRVQLEIRSPTTPWETMRYWIECDKVLNSDKVKLTSWGTTHQNIRT
jgi:hypothetical protein